MLSRDIQVALAGLTSTPKRIADLDSKPSSTRTLTQPGRFDRTRNMESTDVPAKPSTAVTVVTEKKKKRRPARPQVDSKTFNPEKPPQSGLTFNIWYNKFAGGDRDDYQQYAAPNRCNIAKDSGYTKADKVPGSYFCLFFARGICRSS
jgi:hypothetical protein